MFFQKTQTYIQKDSIGSAFTSKDENSPIILEIDFYLSQKKRIITLKYQRLMEAKIKQNHRIQ